MIELVNCEITRGDHGTTLFGIFETSYLISAHAPGSKLLHSWTASGKSTKRCNKGIKKDCLMFGVFYGFLYFLMVESFGKCTDFFW
jgi:hypothetical protein